MKQNSTSIFALLDKSGSMDAIKTPTIEGFNAFLNDQKKVVGECKVSLIQFDDRYEPNYWLMDINNVPQLNTNNFVPRGWTFLYEAMGKLIKEAGEKLESLPEHERPEKTIFLVLSDGKEQHAPERVSWFDNYNVKPEHSSYRKSLYTQEQVKEMVQHQTNKYNWEFVFIGANQNAVLEASKLGIQGVNSLTYGYNTLGASSALKSFSKNVTKFRGGQSVNCSFEKEDYDKQKEAGVK